MILNFFLNDVYVGIINTGYILAYTDLQKKQQLVFDMGE